MTATFLLITADTNKATKFPLSRSATFLFFFLWHRKPNCTFTQPHSWSLPCQTNPLYTFLQTNFSSIFVILQLLNRTTGNYFARPRIRTVQTTARRPRFLLRPFRMVPVPYLKSEQGRFLPYSLLTYLLTYSMEQSPS